MITRIVRMAFRPEEVEKFVKRFYEVEPVISTFDGCRQVQLMQDIKDPSVFFTFSKWDSESHLNIYRDSEFFQETWQWTKNLFSEKPLAWSLNEHELTVPDK